MLRVLLIACSVLVAAGVRADEFPSRTVTIISPYQAGGTSDIIARILAQKLQQRWGKPVIVENRAGANGGIGVAAVAHAAPDGHTLLAVASSALTINPTFYPNLPYDVDRDLAPITRTGIVPNVLVVTPSLPAKNVSELIELAKARGGQLSYASQGIGSNGQVTGELFTADADRDSARSLQGQRAGGAGFTGGSRPPHVRQSSLGAAVHPVGQTSRVGRYHRRARGRIA